MFDDRAIDAFLQYLKTILLFQNKNSNISSHFLGDNLSFVEFNRVHS